MRNARNETGTSTPAVTPIAMLRRSATPATMLSATLPFQRYTSTPRIRPMITPFTMPITSSRRSTLLISRNSSLPSASDRTTSVTVCTPALPPRLAITGMNTTSTSTRSRVLSNALTTAAAPKPEAIATRSHTRRGSSDRPIGPSRLSSSPRPARRNMSSVASSSATSRRSSTVMMPSRRRSSSTTGSAMKL